MFRTEDFSYHSHKRRNFNAKAEIILGCGHFAFMYTRNRQWSYPIIVVTSLFDVHTEGLLLQTPQPPLYSKPHPCWRKKTKCFMCCNCSKHKRKVRRAKNGVWPLRVNRSRDGEFGMLVHGTVPEERHHQYFWMSAFFFGPHHWWAESTGEHTDCQSQWQKGRWWSYAFWLWRHIIRWLVGLCLKSSRRYAEPSGISYSKLSSSHLKHSA